LGVIAAAARIILAAVLVLSAVSKLRAREATRRRTVALLGPRGAVVAAVLPWVELVIAVALLVWWSAIPGIVAAVVLLAFTVVVVRAQLRHLPCPCFGGASDRAAGPGQVLRNAVLIALAILATGSPRP
jgi:hypothetical protein